MLYCPNFFWNVLQVWMTGKDVYLQMTWSWPDKTWNILCSYCLQWNTSQSKFRNHYFLFLFAFSILSQLFLIWGCTRRHVISVSNVTLHLRALYAHSGVPPHTHTQVSPLPLVFVNIKPQNDYLNMTSACLCVNVWRRCVVLFATHTEARVRLAVILTSVASLNISRTALRVTSWAFDRYIWVKLSSHTGMDWE